MSHANRCPDCGHWNDAGDDHCANCNHPLGEHVPRASRPVPRAPGGAPGEAGSGSAAPAVAAAAGREAGTASGTGSGATASGASPAADEPLILRRRRGRHPRSADSQVVLQLWLIFGTVGVAVVLWTGIQGFHKENSSRAVQGSNPAQQDRANALFEALARDSNSVDNHRMLADVLYDTANWSEAIVHYRAAVRRDSSQVTAIVDLGVCYFNLGHPDEAERHFMLALARDPSQNVALFNLGIVNETRNQSEEALRYYHQALRTNPPEAMKAVLQQRISALMQKLGKEAPPLPSGQ